MEPDPANEKLHEAEFFFMMMEKYFDCYEFKHFLSAFLSALYSCTEHNRLHSSDTRFKDWYQGQAKDLMSHQDLVKLREMRRLEVHVRGRETVQEAGLSFPDGITTTHLELGMDLSGGKPVGWYKTAEMEQPEEHPVEQRWVWKTEGYPDVMELCSKGLEVVRELIQSRDEMSFRD